MMMMLAGRFSSSQINKHRHWFCQLVKFAERHPFRVRLSFGPDEVRQFGETESRCETGNTGGWHDSQAAQRGMMTSSVSALLHRMSGKYMP